MKTLITLLLLSSVALAAPKDPRIEAVKSETAKLYHGHVSALDKVTKVIILEQLEDYFISQAVTADKKNFCFVMQLDIVNRTPEVSVVTNNNDVQEVFVHECSAKPTPEELANLKSLNYWPTF